MTLDEIEKLNKREKAALLKHLELELLRPVPEYNGPVMPSWESWKAGRDDVSAVS